MDEPQDKPTDSADKTAEKLPISTLERDKMFEKFLEDSDMEGDGDLYKQFDSSKITKVLKVFLSKSQKRVVAKCE